MTPRPHPSVSATRAAALLFSIFLAVLAAGALLALQACNTDNGVGVSVTELKFQPIADSLGKAGYDRLEIVISKPVASDSTFLYQGPLSADKSIAPFVLPDSLGKTFRVTLRAGKSGDPGLMYSKTYTVVDGTIINFAVAVTPGTGTNPDGFAPVGVLIEADSLALADGGADSALLTAKVLPYPKAKQAVEWSSSNPAVASVDAAGMVRSGAVGKARISAAARADTAKSASIDVTVSKLQKADSVVLGLHAMRVYLGMPASPIGARMVPASIPALLTWRSSNPEAAGVSADGKVTGVSAGQASVWAQSKGNAGIADTCKVTVVFDPPVLDVGGDILVAVGATVDFPIKVTQEFGGIVEFKWTLEGDTLTYSSAASIPTGLSHKYAVAGDYYARFSAQDLEGNVGTAKRLVRVGSAAPLVVIESPKDGALLNATPATVVYRINNLSFTRSVPLREGPDTITVDTVIGGAKGSASIMVTLDSKPPLVVITSPAPGAITNKTSVAVAWTVDGKNQITGLSDSLPLEGENIITREAVDSAGNRGSATVKIIRDSKAPLVAITSPAPGANTNKTSIAVAWTVDGVVQTAGTTDSLPLEGENTITRNFTNAAGSKGTASVKVIRDTKAPVVAITSPAANAKVTVNPVPVAWTVDGVSQSAQTGETMTAGDGEKTITRSFTDSAGNPGTVSIKVILDKDKPLAPVMNAGGTTPSPTNAAGVTWKWAPGGNGNGNYRYWLDTAATPVNPTPVSATSTLVNGLAEGKHTFYIQEADDQGNWSPTASLAIVVDRTGPAIVIDQAAQSVNAAAFTLSAAVSDPSGVACADVAGAGGSNGPMGVAGGKFSRTVSLAAGANTLIVTAKDMLGNAKTASVVITYLASTITITWPPDGYVTSLAPLTVKYSVTTGTTVTPKTKDVTLTAEGSNAVTITEPNAAPRSVQTFFYPNVVFVRKNQPGGKGDGTSWDDAYPEMLAALVSPRGAASGNKLWVSAGSYLGDPGAEGIVLPPGVSVYGGFSDAGRPNSESLRNLAVDSTIIKESVWEGTMMRIDSSAAPVTVDGFVFSMGNPGNGFAGGDMFRASNFTAVTVRNCLFLSPTDTYTTLAFIGGSQATVENCKILDLKKSTSILTASNAKVTLKNTLISGNVSRDFINLSGVILTVTGSTITGNNNDPPPAAANVTLDAVSSIINSGNTSDMAEFK